MIQLFKKKRKEIQGKASLTTWFPSSPRNSIPIHKEIAMNDQDIKYQQAKERVSALRGLYIHLIVYIVINLLLFLINMIFSPATLWFIWPLLGWGIAIALHAFFVFGQSRVLGADWEEKKIQEIMEAEK
jgi:hypothetical protein